MEGAQASTFRGSRQDTPTLSLLDFLPHVSEATSMVSSFCNDIDAARPAPPPPRFARYASSSGPPPPLSRGRKVVAFSRRLRVRVLPKPVHEKPFARKATRVLKWSAGRRRGRGPRHADGCCHPPTLRAWRAPQKIRLREPPASGALRLPALHHHRGSPPRLSTAAAREPPSAPANRHHRLASLLSELTRCVTERGTRCQGLNSCDHRVG